MNVAPGTYVLILISVLMSALAQVLLKTGMSGGAVRESLAQGSGWSSLTLIALNPWVAGGLLVYFLSAGVWLLVLSRVQVSFAYPFVGIGFIVTMLAGWWLFGDTIGAQRIAGTVLVAAGIVLIARGGLLVHYPDFMFQYREAANFPWVSQAEWLYTQMVRWDGLAYDPADAKKAARVFRPDVYGRDGGSGGGQRYASR